MYTNVLYLTNNQFEYGTMMHCWGVVLPNIQWVDLLGTFARNLWFLLPNM